MTRTLIHVYIAMISVGVGAICQDFKLLYEGSQRNELPVYSDETFPVNQVYRPEINSFSDLSSVGNQFVQTAIGQPEIPTYDSFGQPIILSFDQQFVANDPFGNQFDQLSLDNFRKPVINQPANFNQFDQQVNQFGQPVQNQLGLPANNQIIQPASSHINSQTANFAEQVNSSLAPILQCHIRSCEQTITGRRLRYKRALQIVQEEEYLIKADLNVIRRRTKRHDLKTLQEEAVPIIFNVEKESYRDQVPATGPSAASSAVVNLPFPSQLFLPSYGQSLAPVLVQTYTTPLHLFVTLALIAVGTIALLLQANPNQDSPALGQTNSNEPQPGQPGAGQLPIGNSAEVLAALSLVPIGLTAVAVFPPYARPRTFDAISVIFREESDEVLTSRTVRRERRYVNLHRRIGGTIRGAISAAKQKIFDFKKKLFPTKHQAHHQEGAPSVYGSEVFDPDLYGFRTLVRIVKNQPCALGVTCDGNGNKIGVHEDPDFSDPFLRRQTGEEFTSDGPPDCRTQINPDGCIALSP